MRISAFAVIVVLSACGSSSSDSPDAGRTGIDAAVSTCPAAPPSQDLPCPSTGETCVYERCASDGLVSATCVAGTWSVSTESCAAASCQGNSCGEGYVCAANVGGALIIDCRPHECADGPLTCECVCGPDVQCTAGDQYGEGALFSCNTCTSNICP